MAPPAHRLDQEVEGQCRLGVEGDGETTDKAVVRTRAFHFALRSLRRLASIPLRVPRGVFRAWETYCSYKQCVEERCRYCDVDLSGVKLCRWGGFGI
jgi:hypothetical protein